MDDLEESDRPRGVLSKADRRYLLGESELQSAQSERNTRARIRKRIVHAIADFHIIFENLSKKDLRLIFDNERSESAPYPGLIGLIALMYRELSVERFEMVLEEGVNRAEIKDGYSAEVELNLTRLRLESEELKAKLKEGEDMPFHLVFAMLEHRDDVDREIISDYFDEREPRNAGGQED